MRQNGCKWPKGMERTWHGLKLLKMCDNLPEMCEYGGNWVEIPGNEWFWFKWMEIVEN